MENRYLEISELLTANEVNQIKDVVELYTKAGYALRPGKKSAYYSRYRSREGAKRSFSTLKLENLTIVKNNDEDDDDDITEPAKIAVCFDVKKWEALPEPVSDMKVSVTCDDQLTMKKFGMLLVANEKFLDFLKHMQSHNDELTCQEFYDILIGSSKRVTHLGSSESSEQDRYWVEYLKHMQVVTHESGVKYIPDLMEVVDGTYHSDRIICPITKEVQVAETIYHVKIKMSLEQFVKSGEHLLECVK